jgi:hypothetical protein
MELARGPLREKIDAEELRRLRDSGTVFTDERRSRPRYFDGRFLAARDLVRDQNYFLLRQADIGLSGGSGVASGLEVSRIADNPSQLRISSGHGFTPAGELCVLPQSLTIDLNNTPTLERLNTALRLSRRPLPSIRTVTGVFILALRPVEFTANPIASFPTSIEGQRTVTDGDIIEGVAVSMTPFPIEGEQDLDRMRARAAYEIFFSRSSRGLSPNTLPIAMYALRRGAIEWVDPFLVRREIGAQQDEILGLGLSPRLLHEAFFRQYTTHLADVLDERSRANRDFRFPASDYFLALPPAGQLPADAINPADFSQTYFPPTLDCELSLVPEDELPSLLDEGLSLPPIDLTRTDDELDAVSVTIFVPVPRNEFRGVLNSLSSRPRVLRIAAPGVLAKRRPLEVLTTFRLPRVLVPEPDPIDQAWRQVLTRSPLLWYLRRRAVPYRTDLFGVSVTLAPQGEAAEEAAVIAAVAATGSDPNVTLGRATNQARAAILSLFTSLRAKPLMLRAANEELLAVGPQIDSPAVFRIRDRFSDPDIGAGLDRLVAAVGPTLLDDGFVTDSRLVPELDLMARRLEQSEVLSFAQGLNAAVHGGQDVEGVRRFILERLGVTP